MIELSVGNVRKRPICRVDASVELWILDQAVDRIAIGSVALRCAAVVIAPFECPIEAGAVLKTACLGLGT